jgi:hypothetical protein
MEIRFGLEFGVGGGEVLVLVYLGIVIYGKVWCFGSYLD